MYIKESQGNASACVIWMHGLGSEASDMAGLAESLLVKDVNIRHLFMDAPMRPVTINGNMVMRAWYDIVGVELTDRVDAEGIKQSDALIRKAIDSQLNDGFDSTHIFLAGFSQGGAMALHTALHYEQRLGGVIALSAYLPLGLKSQATLDRQTPFFLGLGQFDTLVLPQWTKISKDWLSMQGYNKVAYHQYPMEHSICFEEIQDLSLWLTKNIQGAVE
jgi:phospholipase/carboxylesterase